MKKHYKVIIIGAGPAGIGVANVLQHSGMQDFIILDREKEPGGVPRHCYHPTFGIKNFFLPMTGPAYIRKLISQLDNNAFITNASVIAIKEQGKIEISTSSGIHQLQGERVILATGARETPRHPRLIGGLRPLTGIMTTGALQQFIYLNNYSPPKHPVIVGTEIVSFSALWTLHNAASNVTAIIEQDSRPAIWKAGSFIARLWATPIHYNSSIVRIGGLDKVEYIDIKNNNTYIIQRLICDAVIFTGKFTGENTLTRHSHLQQNPQTGCPLTNQYGQCSDPCYFAAGNMLHPVETGENCYLEGKKIGHCVLASLTNKLPAIIQRIPIEITDPRIKFVAPGAITFDATYRPLDLHLRLSQPFRGKITLHAGEHLLASVNKSWYAQQKIVLKKVPLPAANALQALRLGMTEG